MPGVLLSSFAAYALLAVPGPAVAAALPSTLVADTVVTAAASLEQKYFDPARGSQMAATLREGLAKGRYRQVDSAQALAKQLTADLFSASQDKHLAVVARENAAPGSPLSQVSREVAGARDNFGVHRVELLAGNIGYLDFRAFWRPEEASATLAAAMGTLAHADALILDLRENHGGSTDTLALVASYLLDLPGQRLFEVVPRPPAAPSRYQAEALPLPGRIGNRPLFVLSSPRTFSGGEGLAFLLQERGRAEVIGEQTPGGANVTRSFPINDRFELICCTAEFRSVLSGKNWERTGIRPDVPIASGEALAVAHGRALKALLKAAPAGAWRDALAAALRDLEETSRPK